MSFARAFSAILYKSVVAFAIVCPGIASQYLPNSTDVVVTFVERVQSTSPPYTVQADNGHWSVHRIARRQNPNDETVSIRSANRTRRPYTFYEAYTMLIPSQRHAALLATMYAQIYDAVRDISIDLQLIPAAHVAFLFGFFTLHLIFSRPRGLRNDILEVLEALTLVIHPITYTVVVIGFFGTAIVTMELAKIEGQRFNGG